MKNERISWGLVFGSVLLQWCVMYGSDIFEIELPFSTGLLVADTSGGNMTLVLYSIITVPFLLWLFSGRMEAIAKGYGKLYIIRNYSRRKMFLKEVGKMILGIMLIQCFTWMLFQILSNNVWLPLTTAEQAKIMALYTATLIGTVLLQYCLELMMNRVYAQIATLVYYTASLVVYDSIQNTGILSIMNVLFYPNLGYAMRNGVLGGDIVGDSMIAILVVCVLLSYISLKIIDKKDIM